MKFCKNCGKEIADDSLFCPGCGTKTDLEERNTKGSFFQKREPKKKHALKKLLIILASVLCAGIFLTCGVFYLNETKKLKQLEDYVMSDKISKASDFIADQEDDSIFTDRAYKLLNKVYEQSLEEENIQRARKLFNGKLVRTDKGSLKNIRSEADRYISEKEKGFEKGKIDYKTAASYIQEFCQYDDSSISKNAKQAKDDIDALNVSMEAYEKAEKFSKDKDYENALKNYSNVITADKNYASAQSQMSQIVPIYKEDVMNSLESFLNEKNYSGALENLNLLKKFCQDQDIQDKIIEIQDLKDSYDKEQEAAHIQNLKEIQQVEAISTYVKNVGYSITFMRGNTVVKNNSEKVAKNVIFSMLLFDENGYPVATDYVIYQGKYENEYSCAYNSSNIQPGETYGSDATFEVPDQCRQIKACVKQVEYTDGSVWSNDYYDYWLEENHASY